MKNRTKKNLKYQFNEKTRKEIRSRDGGCIFCQQNYYMQNKDTMLYQIYDIMHYINKSQGGLGIPKNGAVGCRYHHMLLDNGNKGIRQEMLKIFKNYLMRKYEEWEEKDLVYHKWDF